MGAIVLIMELIHENMCVHQGSSGGLEYVRFARNYFGKLPIPRKPVSNVSCLTLKEARPGAAPPAL